MRCALLWHFIQRGLLVRYRRFGKSIGLIFKGNVVQGEESLSRKVGTQVPIYVVRQKSNETDFLLTMNFILFTNQDYPLQNTSLGQLHSDRGVVSTVRSSAGRLLLE